MPKYSTIVSYPLTFRRTDSGHNMGPLDADLVKDTYDEMLTYLKNNGYEGMIIAITSDTDDKNGPYYVNSLDPIIVTKLTTGSSEINNDAIDLSEYA